MWIGNLTVPVGKSTSMRRFLSREASIPGIFILTSLILSMKSNVCIEEHGVN